MFDSYWYLIIFLALGILLFFVLQIIERNSKKKIKETESLIDDFFYIFILSLKPWVYICIVVLAGTTAFNLPDIWHRIANGLILILGTYQGIVSLTAIGTFLLKHLNSKQEREKRVFKAFSKVLSLFLWAIGILFVLSNFGVDVVALLAALGIGGIAIAFAFKSILEDLFSYMTILLDAPIKEGDVIEVDGQEGTVKYIGIKTTRLKTAGGEEIVIPNSTITTNDVTNYGTARFRRVTFSLFFEHGTAQTKLEKLPSQFEEIISGIEGLEFKTSYIKTITAAGIELSTIYNVKTRSVALHRETRNALHLAITKHLTKEKIKLVQADIVANQ